MQIRYLTVRYGTVGTYLNSRYPLQERYLSRDTHKARQASQARDSIQTTVHRRIRLCSESVQKSLRIICSDRD